MKLFYGILIVLKHMRIMVAFSVPIADCVTANPAGSSWACNDAQFGACSTLILRAKADPEKFHCRHFEVEAIHQRSVQEVYEMCVIHSKVCERV